MSGTLTILVAYFLFLFFSIRTDRIYDVRMLALDISCPAVINGPSYYRMFFDLRKWTFKQFYPDLV